MRKTKRTKKKRLTRVPAAASSAVLTAALTVMLTAAIAVTPAISSAVGLAPSAFAASGTKAAAQQKSASAASAAPRRTASTRKITVKAPARAAVRRKAGQTVRSVKKNSGTGLKDYRGKYYTGDSDGFTCIGASMYAQFSSIDHSLPAGTYDNRISRLTRWKIIDGKLTLLDDTNVVDAYKALRFHHPNDLTTDGTNLYIADVSNRIWKVDATGVFYGKTPQVITMDTPANMRISSISYDPASKCFLVCKTADRNDSIRKQPSGSTIDLGALTYYVCRIETASDGTQKLVPYNGKESFDSSNSFYLFNSVTRPSSFLSKLVGKQKYLSIYQSGMYFRNGTLYSGLCIKKLDSTTSTHSTAINASAIMKTTGVIIGPNSIIYQPVQQCTALRDPNAKAKMKKSFELEGLSLYFGSSGKTGAMYGIVREKENTKGGPGVRNNIYDFSSGTGLKYRAGAKPTAN